jgi:hypothetical protein
MGNGTCPLCRGKEDVKHILLSCPETKKWRMQFINKNIWTKSNINGKVG